MCVVVMCTDLNTACTCAVYMYSMSFIVHTLLIMIHVATYIIKPLTSCI